MEIRFLPKFDRPYGRQLFEWVETEDWKPNAYLKEHTVHDGISKSTGLALLTKFKLS